MSRNTSLKRCYMFDRDRLNLLSVLEATQKILDFTKGYSTVEEFSANQRDFDAVMMNFIVIGEMVNRLTSELTDANPQIEWFKIRGFRNIVAHNYFGIDAEEVWQIIKNHIPRLQSEIEKLVQKKK
jgi:uncharacterized protein with HEPN domain